MEPIITSILDNDQYKLSMGQAAMYQGYDRIDVGYKLIDRDRTNYPQGFAELVQEQVRHMANLRLTPAERAFLERKCGHYLRPSFIDWFSHYRYNPDEVTVSQEDGKLSITVEGPWYRTIYWEVPLLAIVSELYFKVMGLAPELGYEEKAYQKAVRLRDAGARYADFGTRRRHSKEVHDTVVGENVRGGGEAFIGTSNIWLAMKYDLTPIGTHAHEWFMAHAGMFGYRMATQIALRTWANEYQGSLGTALTDTFTTDVFLREFGPYYAKLFDGMRQDSGDSLVFADKAVAHYKKYGINPLHKSIVFSDSLTVDRVIEILEYCLGKIQCFFGIGTHLTNDVGHRALNIVMKLFYIIRPEEPNRKIHTIKLADDRGKESDDPEEVAACRHELAIAA